LWTAIFLSCAAITVVSACGGSKSHAAPTPPTAVTDAARSAETVTPAPVDLASQIGVRADLPVADAIDLAARYGTTLGRAPDAKPFASEANVGDTRRFFVARLTGETLAQRAPPAIAEITATLGAKSAHAYFYEDDVLDVPAADVQAAADEFEASTWPTVTGIFGEPAIPGVDGDPRIIVLQADLGGAVGGYYTGDDKYLRAVRALSNEAEMVYMDRTLKPGGAAFNVVLAHEFQHLINAHTAPLEEAWVNEGLSEDSSMLVGGAVSTIKTFASTPETQLNAWDSQGTGAHYGASAAFLRYVASRFGGDPALGVIGKEQGAGAAGVDQFLASAGTPLRFRDVFADWIAANILNRDDGPYGNPGHAIDIRIDNELHAGDSVDGKAHQFGADYLAMPGLDGGDYVLRFRGVTSVPVLPPAAVADGPVLWSNAQDGIDTTLTYAADLRNTANPTVAFKTWFDIERWFDWGYVAASTDGGATWQALAGSLTSADDPARQAFGQGYTGMSGGGTAAAWADETIPLSAFAGKQILLRFEYVTDGSTHGEGWAIRDLKLADGSAPLSVGAPEERGWVNIDASLAQTYIVRLIETKADGGFVVIDVPLDASSGGELRFNSTGVSDAVVAIAGSTEGTNQLAPYTIELQRP
jgi:immune inhibitor A